MDIVMPQMGESISSGTVTRWLKGPGDTVERDETLFEIATDKVDAEIPAPASGVLAEILVQEGATVDVGTVVALLQAEGEAAPASSGAAPAAAAAAAPAAPAAAAAAPAAAPAPAAPAASRANGAGPSSGPLFPESAKGIDSADELRRLRSTPVVRKIAAENNVRIADVPGTGLGGRVTKKDILAYLESGGAASAAAPVAASAAASAAPAGAPAPAGLANAFAFNPSLNPLGPSPYPTHGPNDAVELEPMSNMRREIAKHMAASVSFSAHVTQFIEVDFSAVDRVRGRLKEKLAARGVKLSYTPFILQACAKALQEFPQFNASVDGDTIVRKRDVNLGMAVALDWGLIVPVIKNADGLNLVGLARACEDLAVRARNKKLKPDEVQGGTFTVTNPGIFGALTGTPIINQPQLAILGVGTIEKRVVVVDDAIAIRKRSYFSVTIDHRVLDGADGARFLKYVKDFLEAGDFGEAV